MCGTVKSIFKGVGGLLGMEQSKPAPTTGPSDPGKAQEQADAMAAQSANARLAQRRRALASQSLATGGTSTGKTTFGG